MTVHRSIKIAGEVWNQAVARAEQQGFASTNAYVRYLLTQDLSGGSIEALEDRLVSTISKLSENVRGVGVAQQASFATIWTIIELLVAHLPGAKAGATSEERLAQLRMQIAGEVTQGRAN